ncbi:unnamed protein product [Arabidopsis halleri]
MEEEDVAKQIQRDSIGGGNQRLGFRGNAGDDGKIRKTPGSRRTREVGGGFPRERALSSMAASVIGGDCCCSPRTKEHRLLWLVFRNRRLRVFVGVAISI